MFSGYDRHLNGIKSGLTRLGLDDLHAVREYTLARGINVEEVVHGIQPIAFDDAVWAFILGTALALKSGEQEATKTALKIGD